MTDQTPTITRAERRQELAQTEFQQGAQGGALMSPKNGRELMDMANLMAKSGQMVRDFYRNNPGDCAALIMICQPYGFNPFMVSWKTYKASKNADAPISYEAQLIGAMVNASAPIKGRLKYEYEGVGPELKCTVTGVDRETGEPIVYTSPKIKDIKIQNSPLWKADPEQQLGYFSARSWARRHFPELLLGIYAREEIDEAPMRDVTPAPGGFAQRALEAKAPKDTPEEPKPTPEPSDAPVEAVRDVSDDIAEPDKTAFEYSEGQQAFRDGAIFNDCPYEEGQKEVDWHAGWLSEEAAQ